MEKQKITAVHEKIREIRKQHKTIETNYYYQFTKDSHLQFDTQQTEQSIVFGYRDEKVYRVFYCTTEPKELAALLRTYKPGATMDLIVKEKETEPSVCNEFYAAGYEKHAVYHRYHILDLEKDMYSQIPEDLQGLEAKKYGRYAEERDASEIFRLLENTFDPKESHLQSLDALKSMIRNRNVRIVTENGEIVTLITYWKEGKKLYIEQKINRGRREYMHCLYLGVLEKAKAEGINYVYTWIHAEK